MWYYFGQDPSLLNIAKKPPIFPTFVNIYELCRSDNIVHKTEYSREAMRLLFHFSQNAIYEPPFLYLAKLKDPSNFQFDPQQEIGEWLSFSEKFANGVDIDEDKKKEFTQYLSAKRDGIVRGTAFFNEEADKIKGSIKSKKKHWAKDTYGDTAAFINLVVQATTEGKYDLVGLDMKKAELLLKTLDHFFKTVELSKMKIHPNDWMDFAILAYVQQGDLFWTQEKRWKRLIREAGCGHYLYEK